MGASGLSSRAIIGEFYARLNQNIGAEWVPATSMIFQSDQPSETYKWLGMSPAMREWVGGRNAKGFRENGITIVNKEYEATMEVLRKEMLRDKTGQILVRVREMADRTNAHWASLLSTLILAAEAAGGECYDGQYFIDTDHSEGDSGTQSNDLSITVSGLPVVKEGSTTAPSPETCENAILKCIAEILGFLDDQGQPMNENANSFLVMTPANAFYAACMAACRDQMLTSGKTNTLVSSGFNIGVVCNPRLTWTTKLLVFRTDGNVKPFIRQEEEPVSVDAIAEGSELEFNEDKHHYGVKASRNVGYGYWQHACMATLA